MIPKVTGIYAILWKYQFFTKVRRFKRGYENRLDIYNKHTAPLLEYYKNKGLLRSVDGMSSSDEVEKQISAFLDAKTALKVDF